MAQRPDVRARDIDRALTATALDNAYAEGQLTFDEHRLRSERARVAATLADLRRLVSDLQMSVDLPEPPAREQQSRGRILWALAAVVVVVAALVGYLVTSGPGEPAEPTPSAQPVEAESLPHAPLLDNVEPIVARPFVFDTAEGFEDFRTRYVERFGTSTVEEVYLDIEGNRADVYRIDPDGRRSRVFVDGGFQVDADTDPAEPDEAPLDLMSIDPGVLAGLIAGATQTIGGPGAYVDSVNIDNDDAPEQIAVSVYDADGSIGRVVSTFSGAPISVSDYR